MAPEVYCPWKYAYNSFQQPKAELRANLSTRPEHQNLGVCIMDQDMIYQSLRMF